LAVIKNKIKNINSIPIAIWIKKINLLNRLFFFMIEGMIEDILQRIKQKKRLLYFKLDFSPELVLN